jgi:protein-S-isoprenylcysteine O-methyltransferase Ste14
MTGLYKISLILIFSFAVLIFILLFFVSAPYGKFLRKGWGPAVKTKWAWMIMELPSPVIMSYFFLASPQKELPQIIFICLWMAHYIHRTFIYSFMQSGHNKPYPILIVSMAFIFNCFNGFVNGYGLFRYVVYSFSWIMRWQFIAGFLLFVAGFIINKTADEKLRKLRNSNPDEYVIPTGWLFKYISNPHYFGEIVEWSGWALITYSLPGVAFAVFTFANLFPRAWASHQWYRKTFPDYPKKRKALIPFII